MKTFLVCSDGTVLKLMVERWLGAAAPEERRLLAGIRGPVIDIGCGPGRHLQVLVSGGVPALGIDISPTAIALAFERGLPVLERSVFERIPATGRWRSALLLDGNIGIGGDPVGLLNRIRDLLIRGGCVVLEIDGPGVGLLKTHAWIRSGGQVSNSFPWARVGIDAIHDVATMAGFAVESVNANGNRWFARLLVRSPT